MGYVLDLRKIEGVGKRPLLVAVGVVFVINDKGELLLEKRSDDLTWGLPGGSMELGEKPEESAKRELFEETGLIAEGLTLINVTAGEEAHYIYPNGDEIYAVEINYLCKKVSGQVKIQEEEVLRLEYFNLNNLPKSLCKSALKAIEVIKQNKML